MLLMVPQCAWAQYTITIAPFDGTPSFTVDVTQGTTINGVTARIQDKIGIRPDRQRLFYAGKQLEGGRTLGDYNIGSGATLQLAFRTTAVSGKLPGAFSVSATKRVWFSQGNLQYQADNGDGGSTWRFAIKQYDFVGDATHGNVYENEVKCDNANISSTYTGWIDLFGWATSGNSASGTAYQPWSISTTNSDYGPAISSGEWTAANSDWGVVNAALLGSGWRTLTHDEWVYLINTRTNASNLRTFATVNGVVGLILMPDGWTANGVSLTITTANYTTNNISLADWNTLEEQGCVFLPSDGYRGGDNNTTCDLVQDHGSYWSSTAYSSEHAYYLDVKTGGLDPSYENNRRIGLSVRLVSETMFPGSGTAEDPYIINSEATWNYLADKVNSGTNYSGKYFLQTEDISVTTMVGGSEGHEFSGTFDGYGHKLTVNISNTSTQFAAPFHRVSGGSIKNLYVDGTVSSDQFHMSGLIGRATGTVNISNCVVAVDIRMSSDYAGGFVGNVGSRQYGGESFVTLTGCLFIGTFTEVGGTRNNAAGFCGWGLSTPAFINCLENGTFNTTGNTQPYLYQGTEGYNPTSSSNSYYNHGSMSASWVKQARSITAGTYVTIHDLGDGTEYDVSGITAYPHGIKYNYTYYAGNGDNVSLNLTATAHDGYSVCGYIAGDVTLTGSGNPYTLAMPASDATINARYSASKVINKYTSNANGWYLIASPMTEEVNPEDVTDMTINTYDIFRFNQRAELEWENWEQAGGHYHFNLERGMGYLYANSEDVELVFKGTPYNGNGIVNIRHHDTNPDPRMRGWNLIGNPFGVSATIPKDCYKMKDTHDEVILCESPVTVNPMEGVFVYSSHSSEDVAFTPVTQSKSNGAEGTEDNIVINLHSSLSPLTSHLTSSIIDRAIVSFDESRTLPKFQISESSTKLYIPQNGEDYAIAYSNGQGEMPLNFKAAESGEYTLNFSGDVIASAAKQPTYVHLIDNLTGADVDLLQTPSYTFTAQKDDYASRFRLVFSANENANENEDFAFISNGEIIINGEGTLQIIDILGRELVHKNLSTLNSKLSTLNLTPGVYVLRLINGENVKTQKIVIR